MLYGRDDETARLAELLVRARQGASAALVLRGEAGIGKTELLEHAAALATAHGTRVLRATGIEAESELPFAGLHLLLHRATDRIDDLPRPQADALRAALGLAPSPSAGADRFLVGLAVLTLLADLAEPVRPKESGQPLAEGADGGSVLCLVDDAHWLDRASADALLFAARRLTADGIVMLFAARDAHAPPFPAQGLPELRLTGLDEGAASELLAAHAGDLPRHVRDQIRAESAGNPLALRELPAAQREGRMSAYDYRLGALPSHSRLLATFADRVGALPRATRLLLVVAAAEGTGDLAVTASAASALGASVTDLEPAERKELIGVDGGRFAFRHPLVRAAAYRGAPVGDRIAAHRALADALPRVGNVDRRAWHLAAATTEPDEYVAAALEETAEHARERGGYAAVAAACERAAQLSPEGDHRARRLALAASAAADAGQHERAAELALRVAPHLTDPAVLAHLAQARAVLAREQGRLDTAGAVLLDAAAGIAPHAPGTAAFMAYEAMAAAWHSGHRQAIEETGDRLAGLGLKAPIDALPEAPPYLAAAEGLARLAAGDPGAGLAPLRALFETLRTPRQGQGHTLRERVSIASWFAPLAEVRTGNDLVAELERDCRDQGALGPLPLVLLLRTRTRILLGRHGCALAGADEGLRIAEDTGQPYYARQLRGALAHLAALDGDEERCRDLAGRGSDPRQTLPGLEWGALAVGLLELGNGRYEAALRVYEDVAASPSGHTVAVLYGVPDRVEAAVRTGRAASVRELAADFGAWAGHTGAAWARALAARCRALLAPEAAAGAVYEEALALHADDGRPFERARTELLLGEWLRRAGRRSEARTPLRSALDTFELLAAAPWAERARAELRATGESRARRGGDLAPLEHLTPQERQVVRLAATGMTNRDIGAQLFLSPRTVGYHLYNAYPKLGVASRGELAGLDFSDEREEAA
ncbi:ATP-binding protein [Streptomyces formicae]|uniref:Putative transcriptional regulator n=1 Tax=Streptomyces formicae TaxID=1616117 RepID=A0A291Q572_9ACTN|nr:helix-turn-helix transcriptional regulator [Streptomyces formicae]ATL26604.1 putative transcriptional regulator [Streptomyces formicae]